MDNLTPREKLVFKQLKKGKPVDSDTIMSILEDKDLGLVQKNSTNSLTVMMKYLTAKLCTTGWIIDRVEGGRGKGNKLVYRMEKKF